MATPISLTTIVYCSNSLLMSLAQSSGPAYLIGRPIFSICWMYSGSADAFLNASASLSMISLGVHFGAAKPLFEVMSILMPLSTNVGTLGSSFRRSSVATAMTFAFPSFSMPSTSP